MTQDPTNKEIIKKVDDLSGTVNDLSGTVNDVLDAVNEFSDATDKRFAKVDSHLNYIEANMVTKDYLDDKLADLRGDLVVLMRKEDTKVRKLIDILKKRDLISDEDVKEILSM